MIHTAADVTEGGNDRAENNDFKKISLLRVDTEHVSVHLSKTADSYYTPKNSNDLLVCLFFYILGVYTEHIYRLNAGVCHNEQLN